MKPLTIEQLKSLEVGDWVWIQALDGQYGAYGRVCERFDEDNFRTETIESYLVDPYDTYGTKWLAYKNKEQAEAKGEIVELPCILKSNSTYPKNQVVYINEFGSIIVERFSYEQDAERRLAELRGEK